MDMDDLVTKDGGAPGFDRGAGRINDAYGDFFDPQGEINRPQAEINRLALAQHGVFTLGQLESAGVTRRAVHRRCELGILHRIHQGVYAVAPRTLLRLDGLRMAAVLAVDSEAAGLSHQSAGAVHDLVRSEAGAFHVTTSNRGGRGRAGLRIHRSTTFRVDTDLTTVHGIPCTTVARTLLDLAEVLSPRRLERALDQAQANGTLDLEELSEQIAHARGRPRGASRLRKALAIHLPGSTATWNEIEERFLALIRQAGLPTPEVQAYLELNDGEPIIQPDFLWRAQRVIVETDGWKHHGTRLSFEQDRRRDQRAAAAGFRTLRVTWRQIGSEPARLQLTVASALSGATDAAAAA